MENLFDFIESFVEKHLHDKSVIWQGKHIISNGILMIQEHLMKYDPFKNVTEINALPKCAFHVKRDTWEPVYVFDKSDKNIGTVITLTYDHSEGSDDIGLSGTIDIHSIEIKNTPKRRVLGIKMNVRGLEYYTDSEGKKIGVSRKG